MNDMRERIASLSPEKRALLLGKLNQNTRTKAKETIARPPLQRYERTDDSIPLSFGQQRLWFLDQFDPNNAAYTIAMALHMQGTLDQAALEESINAMVHRHEALRTTFPAVDGQPVQRIIPELRVDLPIVDLAEVAATERDAAAKRVIFDEAQRPFDLAHGPLFRATLLRLDAQDHILFLTMHHIVSDGWSIGVISRELRLLYAAFHAGESLPLADLPLQYADYAQWQRNYLQGAELDRQLAYWKTRLQGIPAVLELPTDRPRPPVQTFRGAVRSGLLPKTLSDDLYCLSKREGATLFMTLLAAYQIVLHRYTGQSDIVVGSPIAGRTQAEIEPMIGFFLNTLVLRTRLERNLSFRDVLKRVRESALGAYAHQDLPFEKLVDELQPTRDLSHNPLFQVMFVLQNMPKESLDFPELSVQRLSVENGTSQVDLAMYVYELDQGLECRVEYNTDLFDAATIDRFLGHFRTVLAAAVVDPQQRVSNLPIVTPEERQQLVLHWNATENADLPEICLHELFEAQAACTPNAIAVSFEAGTRERVTLTYRELDRRANQLARHLQSLGVGPDVLVGIYDERSLEMVVGLYGILKAGGAYVPLDPSYPQDRVAFMLADMQASVLLTQSALRDKLHAAETSARIVYLDTDWPVIAQQSEEQPINEATPRHLAYCIYTSGSTGRPKGALNTHRAIVNRLLWMQRAYQLTDADRVLQKTPFSFDVSVWEFFWPLFVGARLVVARPDGHKDSAYLARLIAEQQITTLHFVPSMLQVFLEESTVEQCTSLCRVICSGEALPSELQHRFFARLDADLHNLYGPTEAAVDVTFWPCQRASSDLIVPIGRPIDNVQIYLLDAQMQPVPVGVAGELHIGGVQLARGYLNRPELTAEKYIPDPYSPIDGRRLYRTGDLARYRPDGNIEYLGRIDHQVKIRGLRIELGEIEAVLEQHPEIAQAVVVAHKDGAGDTALVAYVVEQRTTELRTKDQDSTEDCSLFSVLCSPQELRAFLKERLPEYMVPSVFMPLDALPLSPNGKVDRKALPAPTQARPDAAREVVAPRNALETQIAGIWSEILGLETIGIDDNFFDLGGDSFKAIRVVRKIDTSVSVLDLFKHPTVRTLAEHLTQGMPKLAGLLHELTPPVLPQKRELSLVCIPFAGGSPITYQPLAAALPATYSLYAVELPGHDVSRPDEALESLNEVARRCADEIKQRVTGPIALYGHCMGGALTVAIARLLEADQVELEGVFIGGHFPVPRLPGKLFDSLAKLFPMERWTSQRQALDFLRAMGFFTDLLDPQEQAFVMRSFLHDARNGEDYYTAVYAEGEISKLRAPIMCIFGEMDRATELYQERYLEWEYFAETVEMAVIPHAGHYFLKHQPKDLARIIVDAETSWQAQAASAQTAASPSAPERVSATAPRTHDAKRQRAATSQPRVSPSLRTFFLVAFGQFISLIGTGLTAFAMGIWVYQQTQSVSAFALISVLALLPAIVFAPVAGAVADRFDRRRVMILSDTLAAMSTLGLTTLLWLNALEIWHIYLIVSVHAIANAFQQPAYVAAISQLVPKRYYGRANGIVQLGAASGSLLAPLIGGALVLLIGLPGIVMIDVATFLIAITITLLVRFPQTLFKKREEPFLHEIVGGWRYITKRHGLVAIILFTVAVNYLFGIVEVLATPLTLSFGSTNALGVVLAASGAGLLAGAGLMSVWGGTARRTNGILAAVVLIGLSMAIIGVYPATIFPMVGLFGMGFAVSMLNTHWLSIVQAKVGLELQGRVVSTTNMLAWSMAPLGYLTAGPLAERVFEPLMMQDGLLGASIGQLIGTGEGRGMALLMILAGLITLALAALAYQYKPIRLLEDELPDTLPDAVIVADKDHLQQQMDSQLMLAAS